MLPVYQKWTTIYTNTDEMHKKSTDINAKCHRGGTWEKKIPKNTEISQVFSFQRP